MSFLFLRGEMFYCTECCLSMSLDFIGGARLTQIGDFNVYEQIELNKEFMPKTYDCETDGYYFHKPVLCSRCLHSVLNSETIIYKSDQSPPFETLLSYTKKYSSLMKDCIQEYTDDFISRMDKLFCQQLSPEVYENTIGHKYFRITFKKQELSQKYIHSTRGKLFKAFIAHITNHERYKQMASEYSASISMCEQECRDLLEQGIETYYEEIELNGEVILNPFIVYEALIRKRKAPQEPISVYDGPYEIRTGKLRNFLSKSVSRRLIKLDRYDKEKLFGLIQKKMEEL